MCHHLTQAERERLGLDQPLDEEWADEPDGDPEPNDTEPDRDHEPVPTPSD